MKTVEVLFSDGCPHAELAVERAREAISRADTPVDLHLVRIETADEARRHRFLGSPTLRVDGLDVEVAARSRSTVGLQCRVYLHVGKVTGVPPVEWIEAALRGGSR